MPRRYTPEEMSPAGTHHFTAKEAESFVRRELLEYLAAQPPARLAETRARVRLILRAECRSRRPRHSSLWNLAPLYGIDVRRLEVEE